MSVKNLTAVGNEGRQERYAYGALCMCVAMFGGSAIDAAAKALTAEYSVAQIVLVRGLVAVPLILLWTQRTVGLRALAQAGWGWQTWRSALMAGASFGFFYGLVHVPLVTALMIAYVSPVLIVLLAQPLLGEAITLRRLLGVFTGFVGVLVIVLMGSQTTTAAASGTPLILHPAVWAIVGSALCWALLSISNRHLGQRVATPVMTFYTYPLSIVLALAVGYDSWVTPAGWDWALFVVAGAGSLVAHAFAVMAYGSAPAGFIAPFEYTALIWASLAGYVFWSEVPGWEVWLGGSAVIIGGYIALQSRN
ncbi:MAG: DMT family transporter [Pseudomonadota bacterium]